MSSIRAVSPFEFAFEASFALIATIINLIILIRETRKRTNSQNINYLSQWTKRTSFLCIIAGFLYSIVSMIATFTIFCFIAEPLHALLICAQGVFMGFNQLARLHHCFSESSVHSAKGYNYPNWLFIIMFTIGIMTLINTSICPWFWSDRSCSANIANDEYRWISPHTRDAPGFGLWVSITMIVYILWDIATLSLYIFKILSFRRFKQQNEEVYNRIMFILKKVVILTMMYEILCVLVMASGTIADSVTLSYGDQSIIVILCSILYRVSWQILCVAVNLSVFLMQSHNENEYKQFLTLFYKLKIYYVCCGCMDIFITAGQDSKMELERKMKSTEHTKTDVVMSQVIAK